MIRFLLLSILFMSALPALADEPQEDQAVRCLMGEARGESYQAIIAHAEAYRNRFARYGKVWGVDGCKWRGQEPAWAWERVRKAWRESAGTNLVNGADHWYADYIKAPAWTLAPAVMTAKFGKTRFYKGVK